MLLLYCLHHTLYLAPVEAAALTILAKECNIGTVNQDVIWTVTVVPGSKVSTIKLCIP